jgi:phosphatidylserine decarboxylase
MRLPLQTTGRPLLRASLIPRQRPATLPLVVRRSVHGQQHQQHQQESFFRKLQEALKNTKTEWYAIPIGVGAGVVAFTQLRKKHSQRDEDEKRGEAGGAAGGEQLERRHEKQIKPMRAW